MPGIRRTVAWWDIEGWQDSRRKELVWPSPEVAIVACLIPRPPFLDSAKNRNVQRSPPGGVVVLAPTCWPVDAMEPRSTPGLIWLIGALMATRKKKHLTSLRICRQAAGRDEKKSLGSGTEKITP